MSAEKVAHTPGPRWTGARYDGAEMGCAIIAANTDCGPLPGNPTRGQVAFATAILNTDARRCEANARLIAAAPELLAACRAAMRLDYFHEHSALVEQMRSAIAKAEGRE